jgi:hypothetical protein
MVHQRILHTEYVDISSEDLLLDLRNLLLWQVV